jgi:transposase
MGRSLKTRQPRATEVRRLLAAVEEEDLRPRQKRRAEALLLYADGMSAIDIARALGVNINTVYADLQAFDRDGIACIRHRIGGGAPRRLSDAQIAAILALADTAPVDVGLPYGRWSLTKLRERLMRTQVVRTLSREALRRVLEKGGCRAGVSHASSSATTHAGVPF